jgi:hypothetical protein
MQTITTEQQMNMYQQNTSGKENNNINGIEGQIWT